MLYFDTSYIVRLYTQENGWERVRDLAASNLIACGIHGRAEVIAAFHRKFREGAINKREMDQLIAEFEEECRGDAFDWLALSPAVIERVIRAYSILPAAIYLRAADALHLACAAENALRSVHSNDARLLTAATQFGLMPVNII